MSYFFLFSYDESVSIIDKIIKAGFVSVIVGFTLIMGAELVEWMSEKLRKRHREEGRAEGVKEGRAEMERAWEEWYRREKDKGTLGTKEESKPPFA